MVGFSLRKNVSNFAPDPVFDTLVGSWCSLCLIQDMALNLSSKLLPQRSMVSQNGSVADLVLT